MNKEKQNMVNLLSKIDQKQNELKQLKKEYKTAFSAISKSWKEQVSSTYPNLQPCNIGESVGLDVVYEGRTYNLFIAEERQKLICMFSYDRKDRSTYDLTLKQAGRELKDKLFFFINQKIRLVFTQGTVYTRNLRKKTMTKRLISS